MSKYIKLKKQVMKQYALCDSLWIFLKVLYTDSIAYA